MIDLDRFLDQGPLGMAIGPMGAGAHGFHTQWVRSRVQNFTHGPTPDPY
jgi:hypothetical protein